ncbi:hypothetical protein PGT21_001342 [Puccinia graminis f. sp. tritici]|uniref:Uncharacterized protein n=1 Tax=Puccinia graminis f. sp. tritici TaxID=56615 RepID=A0A5B0QA75_PUCGR|nr:hypothetical protein PGT21_001342 [Puccinia graminis f. sp. tritici]KAA1122619.1 hypothetical protein PGTUg99_003702 [Puccinia graminis f. sp. tritici]
MTSHPNEANNPSAADAENTTPQTSVYMTLIHLPVDHVKPLVCPAISVPPALTTDWLWIECLSDDCSEHMGNYVESGLV